MYARALKTVLQRSCMHYAWTCLWTPRRAKCSNILSSLSPPFPHSFLPPWLTVLPYLGQFVTGSSIVRSFNKLLLFCWTRVSIEWWPQGEGKRERGQSTFGEKDRLARIASKCHKITLLFFYMPCKKNETVCFGFVFVCILYTVSEERKETHTQRAPVGVFFSCVSLVSGCSFSPQWWF